MRKLAVGQQITIYSGAQPGVKSAGELAEVVYVFANGNAHVQIIGTNRNVSISPNGLIPLWGGYWELLP